MIILNEAGQGMWEGEGQVSCKAAGLLGSVNVLTGGNATLGDLHCLLFKMMIKEYYFLDPRDDFFNFSDCFN